MCAQFIPLLMSYKGGRDYLHGTDIFNAVVSVVLEHSRDDNFSGELAFHRFARKQCDMFLVPSSERTELPNNRVCDGVFNGGFESWAVWLMEGAGDVCKRSPFDEDDIVRMSAVRDNTIIQTGVSPYTPIEVAVALTKHLHNTVFPLSGQRWILSKLEYSRLFVPADNENMQVKILLNLHNRITKSELRRGDDRIGYIYFSAVAQ